MPRALPVRRRRRWRGLLAALGLALAGAPSRAHDSWFERESSVRPAEVRLRLGTGEQFPGMQATVGAAALVEHGCRHGDGPRAPLDVLQDTERALRLAARLRSSTSRPAHGRVTCWVQLVPFEITIPAPTVQAYFKEINAPASVREAWAQMQARGVVWTERYTKHARIEWFDPRLGRVDAPPPVATSMGMDILLQGLTRAPRTGQTVAFQVLRDGAPLPDQAVELRSAATALGLWTRTDAEGRAQFRLPLPGAWLLRAVDLRQSTTVPDTWESRFVTLAFDVTSQAE